MSEKRLKSVGSFVDDLQAGGRYTFTRAEVEATDGRSEIGVQAALRRLKKRGRVVGPRRGFYVVVPVEYRSAGSPPASWFIDDLMRFLEQLYYVGLLTSAAIHGAAHQQPMTFQVITDRPTRLVQTARVRIEFHVSRQLDRSCVFNVQTETGSMRVATPEQTAYDLVRYPGAAGHLSNVATVLSELAEKLSPEALLKLAPLFKLPDVQRLGYLLDLVNQDALVDPLAVWLNKRRKRHVLLRADAEAKNKKADNRWRVIANEVVEADL
ncbi:MAG: type IV toxin-antitoxin system AbiEi family antitoxin domain-containing protein [Planctomycetota bacterium]